MGAGKNTGSGVLPGANARASEGEWAAERAGRPSAMPL